MEQAVLSLKRAAWSPRVLPNAAVVLLSEIKRATVSSLGYIYMVSEVGSPSMFRVDRPQKFSLAKMVPRVSVIQISLKAH